MAINEVHGDVAKQTEKEYLKLIVNLLSMRANREKADSWIRTQQWFELDDLR